MLSWESDVLSSPFFYAFYKHHIVKILIDSGATSSLISNKFAQRVGLHVQATDHGAKQLDKSPLPVSGEVSFSIAFGDMILSVDGLVNSQLDYDILGGVPFLKANKIDLLFSNDQDLISIRGTGVGTIKCPQNFNGLHSSH